MLDQIWIAVGGLITVAGSGWLTYIFTKAKYRQEVEKLRVEVLQAQKLAETTEIENGSKIIDLYKASLDDLGSRYEIKYQHLEDMSKNIELLFEKKEEVLKQEIEYHKRQTALYKKMYDDKVREFNKYKKDHP